MDVSSFFGREHETGNLYCGANALEGISQSTFELILEAFPVEHIVDANIDTHTQQVNKLITTFERANSRNRVK